MPLDSVDQLCLEFVLTVTPPAKVFDYSEPGGPVHHFSLLQEHQSLTITAKAAVETHQANPFTGLNLNETDWADLPFASSLGSEFLLPTDYVPHLDEARDLAAQVGNTPSVASWVIQLGEAIHDLLDYDPDATHVHSTLPEVLTKRAGVCQDFAHLMLGCCRVKGIPARYVSGYLYVGEDEHLRGNQASHAWVECLLPDGRWLGVDPTNKQLANDHYIRVHTGRDYNDVTPIRGVYTGFPAESLKVSVTVTRDRIVELAAV